MDESLLRSRSVEHDHHDDQCWWHPLPLKKEKPSICSNCHEPSSSSSASSSLSVSTCCRRVFYCGKACQEEHWLSRHKEECAVLKYLQADAKFLTEHVLLDDEDDDSYDTLLELQEIVLPIHLSRVKANLYVSKKKWNKSTESYHEAWNLTRARTTRVHSSSISKKVKQNGEALLDWYDSIEIQIVSNLIFSCLNECCCSWRYITVDNLQEESIPEETVKRIKKAIKGSEGFEEVWHFANTIKDRGVDESRRMLASEYAKASQLVLMLNESGWMKSNRHAMTWWKFSYRLAQVSYCVLALEQTMQLIEKSKMLFEDHFVNISLGLLFDANNKSDRHRNAVLNHSLKPLEKNTLTLLRLVDPNSSYIKSLDEAEVAHNSKDTSVLFQYLQSGFTNLPADHPRVPFAEMKEEILSLRLIAALEINFEKITYEDGMRVGINKTYKDKAAEIMNKILTTVAQAPLCLFPANGSTERIPPLSVHLLAFFMRACLSPAAMKEFEIEDFCREATGFLTDEDLYRVVCHAFKDVENMHSPMRGHAKSFTVCSQGSCMPCTFRLLRANENNCWADGLRMSVHGGQIEWTAFCLNRLLCGIDSQNIVKVILERDGYGNNASMHCANDNATGFSGLSFRLLAQAVAFSTTNPEEKQKNVQKILNTPDKSGYTPALACISLNNMNGLSALLDLGAKLWDKKATKKFNPAILSLLKSVPERTKTMAKSRGDEATINIINAMESRTNELEFCSNCGNPPKKKREKLLQCSRCSRACYCGKECQVKAWKKHKLVCSSAKVDQNVEWYNNCVSVPRP